VLGLGGCELFNTTVEYRAASVNPSKVSVLYNDANGSGVVVDVTTPWTVSFDVFTADRYFVAALKLTNNADTGSVDIEIREDGVTRRSATVGPLGTAELFYWVY
jgi:hypothetical protein